MAIATRLVCQTVPTTTFTMSRRNPVLATNPEWVRLAVSSMGFHQPQGRVRR